MSTTFVDRLRILLSCTLWFITAAASSNSTKRLLTNNRLPITVIYFQFISAFIYAALLSAFHRMRRIAFVPKIKMMDEVSTRLPSMSLLWEVAPLSCLIVLSHFLSCAAISMASISFVHTIKVGVVVKIVYLLVIILV